MYVVSYFTDADEALHLAVSQDGQEFSPVNEGRPLLRGTVGTGRLRDPFIGIGPDGLFHLLATDGWTSPSIVHATSADLLTWSEQELLPVMAGVDGAHNAWAPEFFLDPATGLYHLIWSSVVEGAGSTAEGRDFANVGQDHRIWHCTTSDFVGYSPAELFFDPGYSVIDATVTHHDGRFVMAFKDERGTNDPSTDHKYILVTTFSQPGTDFTRPTGPVSPAPVEGPAFFRRGEEWVLLFDHYLEGRYGAASSPDGVRWTRSEISLPNGIRHASVLTVPGEHAAALDGAGV
ncbi:glycoside hydrolase family 43 protein [Streptomyces sp. NBC_00988]|uniref:glycoside hydrolase family 43 protein n=1 Tax=Streptomyces sp. NBC_00988 TaxID=2903704 RepID=UPI00386B14EF|nr:glycoside hydrolase family 43 protein [Streptomyces sp. NBC_00988]